jgi:hypothetical protein
MNGHYLKFCRRYNLDPCLDESVRLWEQSLPSYTEEEINWARMNGGTPDKSISDPAESLADALVLFLFFAVIIFALA